MRCQSREPLGVQKFHIMEQTEEENKSLDREGILISVCGEKAQPVRWVNYVAQSEQDSIWTLAKNSVDSPLRFEKESDSNQILLQFECSQREQKQNCCIMRLCHSSSLEGRGWQIQHEGL